MNRSLDNISLKFPKQLIFFVLLTALISLGILIGITRFSGTLRKSVTKVYYADNISPAHQLVIDRFNARYAGQIEVIPIDLPFIKFNTNLRKELLARSLRNQNSLIDIFAIDQVWNSRFAIRAEPLDKYLSNETIKSIIPNILENCYADSILVSIPMHTDVGVLYYRKDIVRAMDPSGKLEQSLTQSMSWSDFINWGKKYNHPHNFYAFQAFNYEGLSVNFMEIIGPKNTRAIFNQNSYEINQDLVSDGVKFLADLIYTYKLAPDNVLEFNENKTYEYAIANNTPFFRGWPTYYQTLKNTPFEGKIGIAALPHIKDQPPGSVIGGWNLMISKHSKVKTEAAIFINYMLSEEVQKTMMLEGGYLSVVSELYSDPDILKKMTYVPYLKQLMDRGFYRPKVKNYTNLSKNLANQIHRQLLKKYGAE